MIWRRFLDDNFFRTFFFVEEKNLKYYLNISQWWNDRNGEFPRFFMDHELANCTSVEGWPLNLPYI